MSRQPDHPFFTDPDEPIARFEAAFDRARRTEGLPEAVNVATVSPEGRPATRMMLLKGVDAGGFVFYTNLGSRKAEHLRCNQHVALCFWWPTLEEQVRVEGRVEALSDAEADAYFASRPRMSQIGAWASRQSQPLDGRATFEARVAEAEARFDGGAVPRPPFWSGYRVTPRRVEFWLGQPNRLHWRKLYTREAADRPWEQALLYP